MDCKFSPPVEADAGTRSRIVIGAGLLSDPSSPLEFPPRQKWYEAMTQAIGPISRVQSRKAGLKKKLCYGVCRFFHVFRKKMG
jgi:hypothetical protein